MPRIRKKRAVDRNVYDLALERINVAFDTFDTVAVSFSGGKDSTACLNLTIQVARERGALPVHVFHYDEEAIPYETEHYVRRVAATPEVDLRWYCLPIKHRNGCSRRSPYWYPWAQEDEEKWVRPLPPEAITWDQVPGFPEDPELRPTMPESVGLVLPPDQYGQVGMVMGIRSDESLTRTRAVLMETSGEHHFIKGHDEGRQGGFNHGNLKKVYPIYDWRTQDVWTAPQRFDWDYNHAYDRMEQAGMEHGDQRCAPPYGEEPMRGLWTFACCFPDIWDRMQTRVPGAATGARYATSELYSFNTQPEKPAGMSWEQWVRHNVDKHPQPYRGQVAQHILAHLNNHYRKTNEPILPNTPHPLTGVSWKFLLTLAVRGDFKGRKQPNMNVNMVDARRKAYDEERVAYEKEIAEHGEHQDAYKGQEEGRF